VHQPANEADDSPAAQQQDHEDVERAHSTRAASEVCKALRAVSRSGTQAPMNAVEELASPIREWTDVGPERFAAEIVPSGQPALLRGAAADWPIVDLARRSPQSLVDYLTGFDIGDLVNMSIAPPGERGRLVYKDGEKALNHRISAEKLPNVLKGLLKLVDAPEPPGIWIGGLSARHQLPGLEEENRTGLVPSGTPAHLWIGNAVTIPPHFDAADNLGFVVAGRRRFTLFPPEQVSNLYMGPFDLTPSGVPISMVPHDAPDFERYPRFRDALAVAQVGELGPGDAIFIPYLWWHGVQSLEPFNLLMNFWWHSDEVAAAYPHGALLRATFELFRNLPAEHRRAWQHMYEYWVFQCHGDPMNDLPPAQHTAPAQLDAEKIARLKQLIGELLS
jgi:hypothetical protein